MSPRHWHWSQRHELSRIKTIFQYLSIPVVQKVGSRNSSSEKEKNSLSRLIPLVWPGVNTVMYYFAQSGPDWVLAEYFIRNGRAGRWLMPGLELLGLMSVPNHCQSNFLPIFNFLRTLINKTCIHTQNTGSNIFIIFLFSQTSTTGWNFFSGKLNNFICRKQIKNSHPIF